MLRFILKEPAGQMWNDHNDGAAAGVGWLQAAYLCHLSALP
jgi:hypothetical protein